MGVSTDGMALCTGSWDSTLRVHIFDLIISEVYTHNWLAGLGIVMVRQSLIDTLTRLLYIPVLPLTPRPLFFSLLSHQYLSIYIPRILSLDPRTAL